MSHNKSPNVINVEEVFGNPRDADLVLEGKDGFGVSWAWPKELGAGLMTRVKLRSGLALGLADFKIAQDISLGYEQMSMPITFSFCAYRHHPYFIYCTDAKKQLCVAGTNHGSLTYRPEWNGEFHYPHKVPVRQLSICITPELLGMLLSGLQGRIPGEIDALATGTTDISFEQTFTTNPMVNRTVHQIFDCTYNGTLKRFYYEAKALELITYAIDRIIGDENSNHNYEKLSPSDVERVNKAREILLGNLEKPPSLLELSKQVGTNKNKLNRDFQIAFGASVFELLRTSRLEEARTLIESGQFSVTQAAFEVGYAHAGNFTRAFRNHFGSHPKDHMSTTVC
ncbi:AraC family transcriptional regulator [Desulfobacter postgatei]|jgi:AraC-like DNA-binding protein|uniref:helix-turn-helix transcriptional regulator n=1 Tax=Desulfobacter postgatei TaxID=2293 RepID=UPI002A3714A8|nr:AraC family transcriptional regulator [Desulfobacter postgatei]MDX9965116.1 AraC family transcriptional regulator [Desulfobacter postgatei]